MKAKIFAWVAPKHLDGRILLIDSQGYLASDHPTYKVFFNTPKRLENRGFICLGPI